MILYVNPLTRTVVMLFTQTANLFGDRKSDFWACWLCIPR